MMGRYISAILFSLILLFAVSTVNASIESWTCTDDKDGGIVMNPGTWAVVDPVKYDYQLSLTGTQNFGPAHVVGDFQTDTELDPTVRILQDVTNDTGFAWTGYQITIGMTKSFSFVDAGLMMPNGWTAITGSVLPNQPLPGDISPGTGWVGTISYSKGLTGAAIDIGSDGTFGFKVSFLGSTNFYTAQVPTPEPTTILLLGLGAMSVIRRRR
jgi:hypothetical protein